MTGRTVVAFVARVAVVAVALWVSAQLVTGIGLATGTRSAQIGTLVGVALIFALVDETLKPLIKGLGCAFYILTLGLIGLVVNALLFMLVGFLAKGLGLPFTVAGFTAAFWGAIVVTVVSWVLHLLIPDRIDQRS